MNAGSVDNPGRRLDQNDRDDLSFLIEPPKLIELLDLIIPAGAPAIESIFQEHKDVRVAASAESSPEEKLLILERRLAELQSKRIAASRTGHDADADVWAFVKLQNRIDSTIEKKFQHQQKLDTLEARLNELIGDRRQSFIAANRGKRQELLDAIAVCQNEINEFQESRTSNLLVVQQVRSEIAEVEALIVSHKAAANEAVLAVQADLAESVERMARYLQLYGAIK